MSARKYEFSVMLWNVCTGDNAEKTESTCWATRGPRVQDEIYENISDIMCFTELSQSGKNSGGLNIYELMAPFSTHQLVFRKYNSYALGAMINTSKFTVGDTRVRSINDSNSTAPFIMMIVDLTHKKSRSPLTLVVTHFPTGWEAKQIASIHFVNNIETMIDSDTPLLICGDFNIHGEENYTAFEEYISGAQVITRGAGTFMNFPTSEYPVHSPDDAHGIDIIIIRGALQAGAVTRPGIDRYEFGSAHDYPSDHLMLTGQLFIVSDTP